MITYSPHCFAIHGVVHQFEHIPCKVVFCSVSLVGVEVYPQFQPRSLFDLDRPVDFSWNPPYLEMKPSSFNVNDIFFFLAEIAYQFWSLLVFGFFSVVVAAKKYPLML